MRVGVRGQIPGISSVPPTWGLGTDSSHQAAIAGAFTCNTVSLAQGYHLKRKEKLDSTQISGFNYDLTFSYMDNYNLFRK